MFLLQFSSVAVLLLGRYISTFIHSYDNMDCVKQKIAFEHVQNLKNHIILPMLSLRAVALHGYIL